ncbi:MAG: hypothetical protein JNN03_19560, partial [Rubrivivax sp.]|nr:hypothetical protein [Rubrivivax sp.]
MKVRKTGAAEAAAAATAASDRAASTEIDQALAAAIGHLREERIDEAEPALQAILARRPGHPDALHYL